MSAAHHQKGWLRSWPFLPIRLPHSGLKRKLQPRRALRTRSETGMKAQNLLPPEHFGFSVEVQKQKILRELCVLCG